MGKGRDKQGREKKKPKKAKQQAASQPNVDFRHHSVVTNQPPAPVRPSE